MKKKIMAMCLVIAMAATAVIGGTLAYFTDTDAETNNVLGTEKIINWDIDTTEGWQAVEGQDNLWVINVPQADANTGKVYNVINGEQVTVNQNVTKTTATVPTLTFTAYAIQSEDLSANTAAGAWALIEK